ncbi:hypothetical protein C7448_103357 [Tenacibaculum gallaicum]|uniref:Uncharacterized protein n=1 Tax=Tenacibaculum gallaicum TaxID=561505 RepID=A0A3E0I1Y9_9FLAO|nr:hypothetical protein [Tenacibaculum gallaicum]REH52621.1 hypothetical protein C7448_103357 [Tenacibaculum gallaicum]
MLKNISNLGTTLNKSEQKIILGGNPPDQDVDLGDPTIEPCIESLCYTDMENMCNHKCCEHIKLIC